MVTPFRKERLLMNHDSKDNVKVQQSLQRIVRPNDKLSHHAMTLSAEEFSSAVEDGAECRAVDAVTKGKKYYTRYWLEHVGEDCNLERLTEFDKDVLTACISFFAGGFDTVSVAMILRLITGSENRHASPEQRAAILASVDKMMCTQIRVDMSATCKKYRDRVSKAEIVSPILPCKRASIRINGQQADVIRFLDESPLITVARAKRQVLTFDVEALKVPGLNNTPRVVTIKFYVVERVHEIIAHKMTPTITYDDVFNHCGLSDASKRQRQEARKVIRAVIEHMKRTNTISEWHECKKGDKYHGIKFVYDSHATN